MIGPFTKGDLVRLNKDYPYNLDGMLLTVTRCVDDEMVEVCVDPNDEYESPCTYHYSLLELVWAQ